MFRVFLNLRGTKLALVAAFAVGLWPAVADAEIISLRNETDFPIMIQGVSIIKGVPRRGIIHVLRAGETVREVHLVPGPKLIIVADAKQPTRVLCQKIIPFTGVDLFYAVRPEEPAKPKEEAADSSKSRARKPVIPKVKLVPSLPTPPPPPPPSNPRR